VDVELAADLFPCRCGTHKRLFAGERSEAEEAPRWSLRSRRLDERDPRRGHRTHIGNAAEHATAVRAAMNNRMDLSLSIAIGSSVQIALFVAPVLVMLSYFVGPQPMDLMFRPGLVFFVFFTVLITAQVAGDGESDWLKGTQLLAVYIILGLLMFFAPIPPSPG
jgi:Sodium/calcium exchanger protein